jgi:rhomboid protease GluP
MNEVPRPPHEPEDAEAGYVPPDPDEARPVDLWATVGDIDPWGTAAILLGWGAVFVVFAVGGAFDDRGALIAWGASLTGLGVADSAWRLLASTFLHSGPGHVLSNAFSMLIFGPTVERLFPRGGFWIVYAAGGAIASLGSLAWRTLRVPGSESLSIGGSGAVFALGGAVLIAALRLRHYIPAGRARALAASVLFLLLPGLMSGLSRHATDNAGHAAGLAAGLALGAVLPLHPRLSGRPAGWPVRAAGALGVLAIGASLAIGVARGLGPR